MGVIFGFFSRHRPSTVRNPQRRIEASILAELRRRDKTHWTKSDSTRRISASATGPPRPPTIAWQTIGKASSNLARVKESRPRFSFVELASRAAFSYSDTQARRRSPLDGAEHGRRMHVPAGPISSDRNTIDRSCLPLPLVPTGDRDRACSQRAL